MTVVQRGQWKWLAMLMLTLACGGSEEEPVVRKATKAPAAARRPTQASVLGGEASLAENRDGVKSPDKQSTTESSTTTVEPTTRGKFLGRLPRDTFVAVRIPNLEALLQDCSKSPMAQLWRASELSSLRTSLQSLMKKGLEKAKLNLPGQVAPNDLLSSFSGEFVVALSEIHPWLRGQTPSNVFFSMVMYAELKPDTSAITKFLDAAFSDGQSTKSVEDNRRVYRHSDSKVTCIVRVEGTEFCAWIGPPESSTEKLDQWSSLATTDSFQAAEVVRSAPRRDSGTGEANFELFINIEPVWKMVMPLAPPQVAAVVSQCKLDRIKGISLVSWLDEHAVEEVVTLHSPGNEDLLSQIVKGHCIDPKWLQLVPPQSENVSLIAFDLGVAYQRFQSILPPQTLREMEKQAQSMEMVTGINVRRDILENLGPHFLVTMRGNLTAPDAMSSSDFDFVFGVEIHNQLSAQRIVDAIVAAGNLISTRKLHQAAKRKFFSVEIPVAANGKTRRFAYSLDSHALLISSSIESMEKVLGATDSEANLPAALQSLAKEASKNAIALGYSDLQAQVRNVSQMLQMLPAVPELSALSLPSTEVLLALTKDWSDSVTWSTQVPEGLRMRSRSAVGVTQASALMGLLTIGPAVLIPHMLASRLGANEAKAIKMLREIHAAQFAFQQKCAVDADGDGVGEFGFIEEMTGATKLRGRATNLVPPLLSPEFNDLKNGCVERGGYLIRVDLIGLSGEPVSEASWSQARGRPLSPDDCEKGWVAYAWPITTGNSGNRVFVIDETGEMFVSDNQGETQGYSGYVQAPAGDAAFLSENSNRNRGTRSVRRGRDGALWLKEEH